MPMQPQQPGGITRAPASKQRQQAPGQGQVFQHLAGAGIDLQAHPGMHPAALQGPGRDHQVPERRVGAGADEHLLHRGPLQFFDRRHLVRRTGLGDEGLKAIQVHLLDCGVARAALGLQGPEIRLPPLQLP